MNWLKQSALFVVGWIESAHKLSSKSNFVCNSVCSTFLRNCKLISNLIRLKHGKSYELISRKIGYIKNPLATEAALFSNERDAIWLKSAGIEFAFRRILYDPMY